MANMKLELNIDPKELVKSLLTLSFDEKVEFVYWLIIHVDDIEFDRAIFKKLDQSNLFEMKG